ncbi:hypothetical protein QR721_01530 [Aciduricibacillus chroicocephali]|uniref:ABC transporter permease n=1 Tax=Aciduricibacillus chroicocephali TaxID=3054939 RepID=A0ABY9KW28_9BACI|nr:hypothetical protein QR721_01530 [Bacillaceae bacterium 44XB]
MRTEICLGLGFYNASLIVLPLILQKTLARDTLLHDLVVGMSFITVLLGVFIPTVVMIWLLHHDMKHPDVWLHTPASSVKLFAVKVFLSALTGIAMIILTEIIVTLTYFNSNASYGFSEMIGIELNLLAILAYLSLSAAFMGLIFWVLYQLLRPHLGKVSLVLTIILYCLYMYGYSKFQETDLYKSVFKMKGLDIGVFTYKSGDFEFIASGFLSIGDLLFDLFLNIALVTLAIILFNKKVRC